LKEVPLTLFYSQHGPVVVMDSTRAIAMRIAGIGNPAIYYEWHQMAMATDWPMFEKAVRTMQLPMFNILYADDRRHISYIYNGNVPRREDGDWSFWNGVVDGSNSRYIWHAILAYDELPKLSDPGTGFLQNANDPPWTCTYPAMLDPHRFPAYLSPQGMALRPQRAVNLIRRDSLISFDGLIGIKQNTGLEAADRFLDELLAAVRQYPDTLASKAAAVLEKWDRTCKADSRGAVLFTRWYDKVGNDMFARPWTPDSPVTTPGGLKDARKAVTLLKQAAAETIKDYDSLDVAWGDVYRFRAGALDLPANGGPDKYGIYRTIYYAKDKDNKYRAVAGDSYVAVTEFGKKVKACVLLSYSNASQAASRHTSDQLPLLAKQELRPALLEKSEILAHLEEKETF
jgi:acyl-homoserine-lactone acylase